VSPNTASKPTLTWNRPARSASSGLPCVERPSDALASSVQSRLVTVNPSLWRKEFVPEPAAERAAGSGRPVATS